MRPTSSSSSQLLPNRNILAKINAVVRKKSHERNTQIPPEWDESTSQAYRLLVGPKISDHVSQKAGTSEESEGQNQEGDQNLQNQKKLLQKLRPSRIKDLPPPVKKSDVSFDALHFPPDLLVQVFPPDSIKKFDLIDRSSKQKSHRIVKPNVKSLNFSQVNASLQPHSHSSQTLLPSDSLSDALHKEEEEVINEEEEIDEQTQDSNDKVVDKSRGSSKLPQLSKVHEALLMTFSARQRLKNITRLRTYFYVLRCWAHYKINSRVKSAFVADVHRTQVILHNLKSWHKYVVKVNRLRRCKLKCEIQNSFRVTKNCFLKWKTKASRAIRNAETARNALLSFNSRLLKKIFPIFQEAAHSRRICRREIQNSFRYKSEGPFTPINEFYTKRRINTIKALHFLFVKKVPPLIQAWVSIVHRTHKDNETSQRVFGIKKRYYFNEWFEAYRHHFHMRQITEIRKISIQKLEKINQLEKEASENIEKTVMMQLIRDRNVLNVKLNQFDRLSQNHSEAVLRRQRMKSQISDTTNSFFKRQEELQLIDFTRQASEIERKTREVRIQLAEGFLYHIRRAVRSYDNQVIASMFCVGFRTICDPVVQKAVGYFYEKRHVKNLVKTANKERKALIAAVKCSTLFHQHRGLEWWRKFMKKTGENRTDGLMLIIRRRTQILQLYPYFNWTEILPIRPPRPLKEIETMFKDLPLVSIQRKVTKERLHHVNAKLLLMRRRLLRDFLRAYAAYVQTQIATREVMKLLRKKQSIRLLRNAFNVLKANANHENYVHQIDQKEIEINSNILAWERHFFRARNKQTQLVNELPYS